MGGNKNMFLPFSGQVQWPPVKPSIPVSQNKSFPQWFRVQGSKTCPSNSANFKIYIMDLAILLCDLFVRVKWPFSMVNRDLQLGDTKVTLNGLGSALSHQLTDFHVTLIVWTPVVMVKTGRFWPSRSFCANARRRYPGITNDCQMCVLFSQNWLF